MKKDQHMYIIQYLTPSSQKRLNYQTSLLYTSSKEALVLFNPEFNIICTFKIILK